MSEQSAASEQENEMLRDAICDMLDFTTGWCRPMTDAEKLAAIRAVGEKAIKETRSHV